MSRDIYILIDGTDCNEDTNSNIYKLYCSIDRKSVKIYRHGIGAYAMFPFLERLFLFNIDLIALDIYKTLSSHKVNKKDRLFILGYSRGGMIARVLAKMVCNKNYVVDIAKNTTIDTIELDRVFFLGAFDPVIGSPNIFKSIIPDIDIVTEPKIANYIELISIDEQFRAFKSNTLSLFNIPPETGSGISPELPKAFDQSAGQAFAVMKGTKRLFFWLPGGHADIGGHDGNPFIGVHALLTIIEQLITITKIDRNPSKIEWNKIQKFILTIGDADITTICQSDNFFRRLLKKKRNVCVDSGNSYLHFIVDIFLYKKVLYTKRRRKIYYDICNELYKLPRTERMYTEIAKSNQKTGEIVNEICKSR